MSDNLNKFSGSEDDSGLSIVYETSDKPAEKPSDKAADNMRAEDDSGLSIVYDTADKGSSAGNSEEDSGTLSFSFAKATAKKIEKDFRFLPFLEDNTDSGDDSSEDDGKEEEQVVGFSFAKAKAAKKEKDLRFLPFLNVSEEPEEEDDDDDRDDRDYDDDDDADKDDFTYLPFLKDSDEDEDEDEKDDDKKETDTGIYVVGGDEDLQKYREKSRQKKPQSGKKSAPQGKKGKRPPEKGKRPAAQRQGQNGRNPTIQQIIDNMDPDIVSAISNDPRQMMLLEETIRRELINQAASKAVAKILEPDEDDKPQASKNGKRPPEKGKRPPQKRPMNQKGRPNGMKGGSMRGDLTPMELGQPIEIGGTPSSPSGGPGDLLMRGVIPPQAMMDNLDGIRMEEQGEKVAEAPTNLAPNLGEERKIGEKKPYTPTSPAAMRAAIKAGTLTFEEKNETPTIESTRQTKSGRKANQKRSGCVISVIVIFMLAFIGVIIMLVAPALRNESSYQEAVTLSANGQYEQAIEIFTTISTYKDSMTKIRDSWYNLGVQAETAGDYEKAAESFGKIALSYDLAYDKLYEICRSEGQRLEEAGDYLSSYKYYNMLADNDEGMLTLAQEVNDRYARQLISEKKYDEAVERLSIYPTYGNSASMMNDAKYSAAQEKYNAGSYEEAVSRFTDLGDFSDSALMSIKAKHFLLQNDTEQKYSQLIYQSTLQELEQFVADTEVAAMMNNLIYNEAKAIGNWSDLYGNSLTYSVTSTSAVFEFSFPSNIADNSYSNLKFEGSSVYLDYNGTTQELMRNISFTPAGKASPEEMTFVNPYNGLEYTLRRTE
ncbi:MAG: tetratricopeptide repeat protein [Oscillospiraceae bacterium]|jgi:TolA-binding protein|nr:tetratricopeptide repeat protein [Oscillospiraceae bacterium]